MAKLIIITDLDGTLIHPKTYSFDAALPALDLINEKGIPLVLCSSKTRAEIEVYRRRLGNSHPFISENGGGIFIPKGYFQSPINEEPQNDYIVITLGMNYSKIRNIFSEIRERTGIKISGFGDMTVEEVAALTGLPIEEAKIAKKRDFDEPFVFDENEARVQAFLEAIDDAGLTWTQGRFYHILGENDKGKAVKILIGLYKKEFGAVKTIGLGDSLNDLPLLKEVDYPVLVQKPGKGYEEEVKNVPNLIKADAVGPEGWNKAVIRFLKNENTQGLMYNSD